MREDFLFIEGMYEKPTRGGESLRRSLGGISGNVAGAEGAEENHQQAFLHI
jgi:hypothetical protein